MRHSTLRRSRTLTVWALGLQRCEFKSLFSWMHQCQMMPFGTLVLETLGNANLVVLSDELVRGAGL